MVAMGAPCCAHRHRYCSHLQHLVLAPAGRPHLRRPRRRHQCLATSISCSAGVSGPSPAPACRGPANADRNHLIQLLCRRGNLRQALRLLSRELNPTQRTFEVLIQSCARCRRGDGPSLGDAVDRRLVDDGMGQDSFLSTRLIEMYAEFGAVREARRVFDRTREKTVFVWNAMLRALVLADQSKEAFPLLREMVSSEVPLDSFTYSFILKACVGVPSNSSSAFSRIGEIHCHALRHGFESQIHVTTTLVDVYAKIGDIHNARRTFDGMPTKNVVSWSAMVGCYAKNERCLEALQLFHDMVVQDMDGAVPNSVTAVSVLQACANLAALEQGKMVHAYILRRRLDSVLSVVNALIAMYIKCGDLVTGRLMFDNMSSRRDVVTWNSMISGYGIHGLGRNAINAFDEMIDAGVAPSSITFISVLGACSHVGLVEDGKRLFDSMAGEHGLSPTAEHYACLVDLLGRAGHLEAAAGVVEEMRIEPGPTVWGSLLGACRIHGNVELAERACSHLFDIEPRNAGNYVLLADIYAGAKMWGEVDRVKKLLGARGLQKLAGRSWIEVRRKVYSFVSVDEMNQQIEQLQALLFKMVKEMKGSGYIPQTRAVLCDVAREEEEQILLGHSEKLALAFGLINCRDGEVIRITKNLRLCEDCHAVTKFISTFTKREIFVRDVNRFHHFWDGACSCGDYW